MNALPPLIASGPPLTGDDAQRYARHLLVPAVGEAGQRRLRGAHVAVLGAGGLGSPALLYLAAAGVGTLTIIDDDDVDPTNLQRQIIHPTSAIGQPKVDSAAAAVRALNPDVAVHTHRVRLDADNAPDLLRGADLALDGTDNFDTRYAISDACTAANLPYVWASVYRTQAQVSVFWAAPPGDAVGVTLRDLFPDPPAPGTVPACGDAGVLGALTGQVGSLMAAEAIKLICGIGEPLLGTLAFIDLLTATCTHLPLAPRQPAPAAAAEAAAATPPTPAFPRVSPRTLAAELASPHPPLVLDVREPAEWAFGVIPGARCLPLGDLLDQPPRLPRDADIVLHCKTGPRAERAAAALAASGHTRIRLLDGGILAWRRDVDPTITGY